MNYRHAFHAGNHADVFKHAALTLIVEHLLAKPQPFAVLDTHPDTRDKPELEVPYVTEVWWTKCS